MPKNERIPEDRMNFTSTVGQALKNVANGGTLNSADLDKLRETKQDRPNEKG